MSVSNGFSVILGMTNVINTLQKTIGRTQTQFASLTTNKPQHMCFLNMSVLSLPITPHNNPHINEEEHNR